MSDILLLFLLVGRAFYALFKNKVGDIFSILFVFITIIGLISGELSWFFVFFVIGFYVSMGILMKIFSYTTYHKNFPTHSVLLLLLAIVNSFLISQFYELNFFIWFIFLVLGSLFIGYEKNHKVLPEFLKLLSKDEEVLSFVKESNKNTKRYWFLSSFTYLLSLIISYVLLNWYILNI